MIEVFASVGASRFDVTRTTLDGENAGFQRGVGLEELRRSLPMMLDDTERKILNLIVRPHGKGIHFIQLDDLKASQLVTLAPAVFLSLQTSPGNFQAWVAIARSEDREFARRLRKGAGADPTASGATRIAGSSNFKPKYAPNFPRVSIHEAVPGRRTTAADLERLGLVAPEEPVQRAAADRPARSRPGPGARKWPNYERCLENAPPSQSSPGDTRHSIADFTWCLIAADWGWPVEDIARRLMEESGKARDNGFAYAQKTATRAAEAAARNAVQMVERRQ
jgi:hypothetical protein